MSNALAFMMLSFC